MFQPVVPLSGIGGWAFLQSTYDRQLESYADSADIKQDRAYLTEKLSQPMTMEDLVGDRRLLRVALTAFDLAGEEWKGGFIRKVLTEAADPESTFLARLNNPQYTRFAEAFRPVDGKIQFTAEQVEQLGDMYEAASFELAVGDVDNSMRLGLNFKSEIGELVKDGSSEDAVLYRLLGSVPVRTVLETALNLPSDIRKLPIEKQADLVGEKIKSAFGIGNVADLKEPEVTEKVIRRFLAMESIQQSTAPSGPAATALTLLSGLGSTGSQNLFLASLL